MNPTRIVNYGFKNTFVVPSAETAENFKLIETVGFRKARLNVGHINNPVTGAELAMVYKFRSSDSTYYPLDGADGPKVSLATSGAKTSGKIDLDSAVYDVACGVYIGLAWRDGDDVSTIDVLNITLELSES